MKKGFSLIELLVAISVIAVIIGIALPNFLGARERARDAKRKTELNQFKSALRLYYSDYTRYPTTPNSLSINACGAAGTTVCPCSTSVDFAAGGTGCDTVYMKKFPRMGTSQEYRYYQFTSGEDFRLKVTLENRSDQDLAASQLRCPAGTATSPVGQSVTFIATEYVVCAD